LIDFLDYIGINLSEVELVVFLPTVNEPLEISELFYSKKIKYLRDFLIHNKKLSEEKILLFINWLHFIDKLVNNISPSRISVLTIEDSMEFSNIMSKLRDHGNLLAVEKQKSFLLVLNTISEFRKAYKNYE